MGTVLFLTVITMVAFVTIRAHNLRKRQRALEQMINQHSRIKSARNSK